MQQKGFEIDLSDHSNPAGFVRKARKRFPDKNVKLNLEGATLRVAIAKKVPSQIKIDICSFLQQFAQEDASFKQV